MFGVHIPAWPPVPFILTLRICFVSQMHTIASQVEDSRGQTYKRHGEEECTTIEDCEKMCPGECHCGVARLVVQAVDSQNTRIVSIYAIFLCIDTHRE